MINWILGSLIAGLTIFIIVRNIIRMKNGSSSCCSGCSSSGKKDCHCEYKPKG